METTSEGLSYDISYKKKFKVSRNTTYDQFLEKLFKVLDVSSTSNRLSLTCRYPYLTTLTEFKYMRLAVDDNDSL